MTSSTNLKSRESSTSVKAPPTSSAEMLSLREDELQSDSVANNRCMRDAESEEIKRLTEQNRRQASEISKLKADSDENEANLNAQLRECHRERQALMERIEHLTEQNDRHSTFRGQIAFIVSHQVTFWCILAIIPCVVYLHCNMASENHILQEQNANLTKQIDKLNVVNSENLLFRDQIAIANQQMEFLQSEMRNMSTDFKEKDNQAMASRLKEIESYRESMNYLFRCLRNQDNASQKFTGVKLFWRGRAVQVGHTTRNVLDNCLTMIEAEATSYRPQFS